MLNSSHQLLHKPTHLCIKKLTAEVLVNLTEDTQVILLPFEGFWLIIPVLIQTHQCQSSPGLAGSLSLTAHGLGLLSSKDKQHFCDALLPQGKDDQLALQKVILNICYTTRYLFSYLKNFLKKGACNWAANSHRLPQDAVTRRSHSTIVQGRSLLQIL